MKQDLARIVELDATLGEISEEAAKTARKDSESAGAWAITSFSISSVSLALAAGLTLGGCVGAGAGCGVGGFMFLMAARWCSQMMKKNDTIYLAYLQRDRLRELRGDELLLPEKKKKR